MRAIVILLLLITSCTSSVETPAQALIDDRPTIAVPLSLYVAIEDASSTDGDPDLSSQRTVAEVEAIGERMNELWAPARIVFDPINVQELAVPRTVLQAILLGDSTQFFAEVNRTFVVTNPGAINGFYVQAAFGVNGFTPQGSSVFFVVDEPSVLDERVSSHEVGHILGLRHPLTDPSRLMFSGTNGTSLTEAEQFVARYGAQGLAEAR